jgi:glutamate-1-semialdehyde 2,1-aminomutase
MIQIFNSNLKLDPHFTAADGEHLISATGKRYKDLWLGSGALFFGHSRIIVEFPAYMLPDGPPNLTKEIISLLEKGLGFNIAGIGFQTSGSSAVIRAFRIARALTARDKIAVIGKFWHGSDDDCLFEGVNKKKLSVGIPDAKQVNTIWFETLEDFINVSNIDQFAAVISEPYQGANPSKFQFEYFLNSTNRDYLRKKGILVISDEVITGFRQKFGLTNLSDVIQPDIVILGKSISSGFPIGVVVVRSIAGYKQPIEGLFWGGTFSGSPYQLAHVRDTLQRMLSIDYKIYTEKFVDTCNLLQKICENLKFKLDLGPNFARLIDIDDVELSARKFNESKQGRFSELRNYLLLEGYYVGANGLIFESFMGPHNK